MLDGLTGDDAQRTAERLRIAVAGITTPLPLTISVGVASCPAHASTRDDLVSAADEALYASKRSGKNRTTVAGISRAPDDGSAANVGPLIALLHGRDPAAIQRGRAVATLAVDLGRAVGVADPRLADLRTAAQLHELGRVGLPETVLRGSGPPTPSEQALLRTVPVVGAELLRAHGLTTAARFVLEHRERSDGRGFPDGLRNGAIAIESQVLHVAATYTPLRSGAPGQPALDEADAIMHLRRRCAGAVPPALIEHAVALVTRRPVNSR